MNKQAIFDKFVEFMGRFAEIRAVAALRDGFIMTTPFTVCGSVFLLIANLPIPGYPEPDRHTPDCRRSPTVKGAGSDPAGANPFGRTALFQVGSAASWDFAVAVRRAANRGGLCPAMGRFSL